TTQAFNIDVFSLSRVTTDHHVSRNILTDRGAHTAKTVSSDFTKLVHQRETAEDCPITDMHMASQGGVINQNTVIADHAVVTNMNVSHQQIIIANGSLAAVLNGTAMNGDAFTNNVVVTNHQASCFTLILQVRGIFTD